MASRTTINDFQPALESIDKLLEKYEPKHQGAWLKQPISTHISHAVEHGKTLLLAMREIPIENFNFEDLQSLACRALMALTLAIEEGKN